MLLFFSWIEESFINGIDDFQLDYPRVIIKKEESWCMCVLVLSFFVKRKNKLLHINMYLYAIRFV